MVPDILSPRKLILPLVQLADPSATLTFSFGKLSGQGGSYDTNSKFQITGAHVTSNATVTADNTNAWNLKVQKYDGSTTTVIAACTTDANGPVTWTATDGTAQTTGNGATWTARTAKHFTLTSDVNDRRIDVDENVEVVVEDVGAPATLNAVVVVNYIYGHINA